MSGGHAPARGWHSLASEIHAWARVDHAPACGGWMERRRSSAGRGEALEHGGGARLRPELVEVNRSDLEKTRSVNRCKSVKRPVRVSGEAAEGTGGWGRRSMGAELQQ
jgi:hypothetical protein